MLLTKNEADLEHEGLGGEPAAAERTMKTLSLLDGLKEKKKKYIYTHTHTHTYIFDDLTEIYFSWTEEPGKLQFMGSQRVGND